MDEIAEPRELVWNHRSKQWGPWCFIETKTNTGRHVFDCLSYAKAVFMVTYATSVYGEVENYKKKLKALGYEIAVTTKEELRQFITDKKDELDILYYSGIDYYLIGALK